MKIEFEKEILSKIFHSKKNILSTGMDKIDADNFEFEMDMHIDTLLRKVINGSYKFTKLRQCKINSRDIYIPTIRDRLVHEVLKNNLKRKYRIKLQNRNDVISSIYRILSEEIDYYVVRLDIKNYFPSVPTDTLLRNIERNALLSNVEYELISKILKGNTGLIQGLSTSNYFAEIFLESFDNDFEFIHERKIYYSRYVDDIILIITGKLTKYEIKELKDKIDLCFKKVQLSPNFKKYKHIKFYSGINTVPFDFLGYTFWRENRSNEYKFKCEIADEKIQKYYDRINRIFSLFNIDNNSELLFLRIQALFYDHKIAKSNIYIDKNGDVSYYTYKVSYGLNSNYEYAGDESYKKIVVFIKRKISSNKYKKNIERKYKNLIFYIMNNTKNKKVIDYSKIPMHELRRIVYRNIFKNSGILTYTGVLSLKKYELINYYYRLINR